MIALYILMFFFSYTHILMRKFHWSIGHSKRLATISNNKIEQLYWYTEIKNYVNVVSFSKSYCPILTLLLVTTYDKVPLRWGWGKVNDVGIMTWRQAATDLLRIPLKEDHVLWQSCQSWLSIMSNHVHWQGDNWNLGKQNWI